MFSNKFKKGGGKSDKNQAKTTDSEIDHLQQAQREQRQENAKKMPNIYEDLLLEDEEKMFEDTMTEEPSQEKEKNRKPAEKNQENQNNVTPPTSQDVHSDDDTVEGDNTTKKIPKRVNNESVNRRQKKKRNTSSKNKQQKTNGRSFKHKTYFSTRLVVPASDNPVLATHKVIDTFVKELHQADVGTEILPYTAYNALEKNLKVDKSIPKNIDALKTWFDGIYIRKGAEKGTTVYARILVGHDQEASTILDCMDAWLRKYKHGLYRCMVQKEQVTEIGWLLFSTRSMDAGALADEMQEVFKEEIGLKWKTIATGKGILTESQKVQALVVEVEKKKERTMMSKLLKFYDRKHDKREEYPNGVRFRFIKDIKKCANAVEKAKCAECRYKQKRFQEVIRKTTVYDIEQIDYAKNGEMTLRQMAMSIDCHNRPGVPLFISVDLGWTGENHTFEYAQEHQVEAECMIDNMLIYLRHLYPEVNVDAYFDQEAIDRAVYYEIDPKTGLVVDKDLTTSTDTSDDEILGFQLQFEPEAAESLMRPKTSMPYDDDSVSTMHTSGTPSKKRKATRPSTTTKDDNSVLSSTSALTASTLKTLGDEIDTLKDSMAKTQADMEFKFNLILERLNVGSGGRPNQPNSDAANTSSKPRAGDGS